MTNDFRCYNVIVYDCKNESYTRHSENKHPTNCCLYHLFARNLINYSDFIFIAVSCLSGPLKDDKDEILSFFVLAVRADCGRTSCESQLGPLVIKF